MVVIRTTGVEDYLDGGTGRIKCLVMGAPSAGKTRSSCYWPKPILLDCEKGRMSVADLRVPYAEINTVLDMTEVMRRLELECKKPWQARQYHTLIVDTLDAYQRIVMQERLDDEKKEAFSGWQDWGYLDARMMTFVQRLNALPMNVVVNLHVKSIKVGETDDSDGYLVDGPKLKGDLKDQIAAEFDLVGYMGTSWVAKDGERTLVRAIQWHPTPSRPILKDRSGRLPKLTDVTFSGEDYATIYGHLLGGLDDLKQSEVVEELEPEPVAVPEPPKAGGAVRRSAPKAQKAAQVPPAARPEPVLPPQPQAPAPVEIVPPEVEPEVEQVPVAPEDGATSTPAPDPEPSEPVELAEAVTTVVDTLGGEVISEDVPVEASPVVLCGTNSEGGPGVVSGCGKELAHPSTLDRSNKDHMFQEVAYLRTRTHLCPDCYAAHRGK